MYQQKYAPYAAMFCSSLRPSADWNNY